MPSRERVETFLKEVVEGSHVTAIADFYHDDATMQENLGVPRSGREALMAREQSVLERIQKMHTHPVQIFLVDGDNVAIRWTFDRIDKDGTVRRLEEVALQQWRGDRIVKEQFFYDTATAWSLVGPDGTVVQS
ncbi:MULTISPECIES: nuclear transport factor 2 family protein [unclassified Mesorhizobium]|uniref:nuclear transport factor 2 family protein n=1 Tax=unclassified Mesorhizobium TaxID=325217 RepID=UPI000FCA32F5|nr:MULTISPECIES: nuclear transport factor 2 family protein [unclassified Mesorhizobium]RUX90981.1 nuclear transport factor 2 family protein [Mesorhizobium sp. M7D.F.Ca.US.004.01.2.1]RVA29594.1 nuclear transport factor 2 family protein [Mesorhizobium sp. M7D.F.Ca.US.004.03.1.1]